MKKVLIVLSCIVVVLTLCACNSNKKEETKYTLNVVYKGGAMDNTTRSEINSCMDSGVYIE